MRIYPLAPELWEHVEPGATIRAHEGSRVVGSDALLNSRRRIDFSVSVDGIRLAAEPGHRV